MIMGILKKLICFIIYKCVWIRKDVFVFSGFLFINSITDQITNSTDTLLLGMFSGTSAVALYTIGYTFGRYFTSISTSVSSVFAPKINKIVAEDKNNNAALNDIFQRIGRVQCLIVSFILIGYIIFGVPFINLWAGVYFVQIRPLARENKASVTE